MPVCRCTRAPCPESSRRACDVLISWCGNSRSEPPPSTSNGQPEGVAGDDRALDVPAGPAAAERAAVPGRLPRALPAPQQRVERRPLAGPVGVAAALARERAHGVVVEPGDGAEVDVGREVGVHVAQSVVGPVERLGRRHAVRGAGGEQDLDGLDDGGMTSTTPKYDVGRDDRQRGHVLGVQRGLLGGQVAPVDAGRGGTLEQRVVDVGDVRGVPRRGARRRAMRARARRTRRRWRRDPGGSRRTGVMPQTYSVASGPAAATTSRSVEESRTWTGRPRPGSCGM